MDLRNALRGITPPLVTPFDGADIDEAAFQSLLDHVLQGGVDALFPCGTTGEAASLTRDEQASLVRHTVEASPPDVPVLAGGTGTAIEATRTWIADVASLGADGVFLTAPYFHPANDPSGYQRFFEAVLEDSPLPVLLYNIPGYVGTEIPPSVVEAIAGHDRVMGMKDSSGDLGYGRGIRDRNPADFLVLQGIDELLLPACRMGFDGGVNAGANVFPEIYGSLVREPFADTAMEHHRDVVQPLFAFCEANGFAPAIKAALVTEHVLEQYDVRPPLVSVDESVARSTLS